MGFFAHIFHRNESAAPERQVSATSAEATAELRTTERRLETLLDQLPHVILYETDGGREYISNNIEKLLGFTAEELTHVRGTFPALIHPIDNEALGKGLAGWTEAGRPGIFTAQFRVRKRSGEYIWIEDQITGVQYEDGRQGMIGVMVDITSRHQAQERYQAIVGAADFAGLGLCIIGNKHGLPAVTFFNSAALAMCDRTADEVFGRPVTRFLPKSAWPEIDQRWQQFRRGELVRDSFETELLRREGDPVPVSISLTVMSLDEEPAIVAFITNITERKRVAEELVAARIEAEEISHIKSNILSNFSHELRTPLHSILGFSSILAEETVEDELKEYARSIQRSGQRLLSTVTSIIELAALESNVRDRVLYPISLHDLLQEDVLHFRPAVEEHGLTLEMDLRAKDMIVLLEKDRFHKAIEKIINNAIKFTHKGFVRIELDEEADSGARSDGFQVTTFAKSNRRAIIRIRDSGIGMSQEFLEKAFDKFKQESAGFSRKYEGTGLGLPLARSYIRLMNGDISLQSTPGEGTVVTIRFPVVGKLTPETGTR